jgi:hypothetical protein
MLQERAQRSDERHVGRFRGHLPTPPAAVDARFFAASAPAASRLPDARKC